MLQIQSEGPKDLKRTGEGKLILLDRRIMASIRSMLLPSRPPESLTTAAGVIAPLLNRVVLGRIYRGKARNLIFVLILESGERLCIYEVFPWSKTLVKKWFNIKSKTEDFHADDIISGGVDEEWRNQHPPPPPPFKAFHYKKTGRPQGIL
ncbi:hypothetical protein ACS0TY_009283 [Phlomoides rotata]